MAKKNVRDEPLKPQVTENEQMSDIVLILDKMELLLQAVSKLPQTVRDCPPRQGKPKYQPSKSRRNGKEKRNTAAGRPR